MEKGLENLTILMTFELFIWLKKLRNVIEIALKLVFLSQNYKNRLAAGGSATPGPLCGTLELYQFAQHGA